MSKETGKKTLVYRVDFKIEQSNMIVEHFIWKCPYCSKQNRTFEFNVTDCELFCVGCGKFSIYSFNK
jgi:hypothetical protein